MSKLHLDLAAEKEADDIGKKFMNSTDVVGDMSRAYGADLSSVKIHTDDAAAGQAAARGVDAFSTGKDVFFGRDVFRQNDSDSRGILAHELAHSLQQGVGGETGAVQQSAPVGAEQGLFFANHWRRHKQRKAEEAARRREIEEMEISGPQEADVLLNRENNYLQMMTLLENYSAPKAQMGKSGGTDAINAVGAILGDAQDEGSVASQVDAAFKTEGVAAGLTKLGFRDKQWGMNDKLTASRGTLYSGINKEAGKYAEQLMATGIDMTAIHQAYQDSDKDPETGKMILQADGKAYKTTPAMVEMAKNFLSIAETHLSTDESLDYLDALSGQFKGLDLFDEGKGGKNVIHALVENILLREAPANAAAAQLGKGLGSQTGSELERTKAGQRVMMGTGAILQKVFSMSYMSDEVIQKMPEEVQSMFQQVKDISKQIEQKMANRKKASAK